MADKVLTKLLTRLGESPDALGSYARSILSHDGFKHASTSADTVEPEGSTDPFTYDPNVEALLASGIISPEEKADPVALVTKLASILIGMRNAVTRDVESAVDVADLNQTEVQNFDTYYREKLRGVAQAEIVYDDPILFQNLKPEEAAGLARALIAVTKVTRPLWVEISNTGRGK